MERYLTLEETAEELRVTKPVILKLLKQRRLVGIEITPGHWRVADPSLRLRSYLNDTPVERFPFITKQEAAEILGMHPENLKWHIRAGHAKPTEVEGGPHCQVFTVHELRRFAAFRERLRGQKKMLYSPLIIKWAKNYLADDLTDNAEILAELLDEAVKLPEPKKSETIVKLWGLFNEVDRLLKE